ncbi:luciferin 4-monooxygenase-like isoform X2 [Rhipicephalus microplus]|uniref:luciferin 4-monooxygenase-like isoform X2 n=1 Tax=Rhipicephalus microplus TaxID=6941 RepID=UPI003F6C24AA
MTSTVSTFIEDNVIKTRVIGATIPDVDFATFFSDVWQKHADQKALVDVRLGMQYTFGELLDASSRVATGLQKFRLRQGDVVAIHCVNSCELIVALCGTFFAGGVVSFIKPSLNEGETRSELMQCQPKFVVTDIETMKKVKDACEFLSSVEMFFVTSGSYEGALSLSELKETPLVEQETTLNLSGSSVLAIIFSSGSTGLPKGVLLTHRNFISQVVAQSYMNDPPVFEKGETFLLIPPIMHISGFWLTFCYLGLGCEVVLVPTWDFEVILPAIEKYKPTTLGLLPTFFLKLDQHPLLGQVDTSSVKKVMLGGSTLNSSVLQSVARKLGLGGVIQLFGMTELAGSVTASLPRGDDFKSVGKPIPFMEIKVVDITTREPLGPGEKGEICIKGPCTFLGYLNKPKETADAYEDGFLRTGDTGYYSTDGRLFVCSRFKDLIKCMDQQVPPAEIEELLARDPRVKQVVVAGVPHPQYGEAARAFVVPRQRLVGPAEEQLEADRLKTLVAAELSYHKQLHGGVEFLDGIPHTESGKDRRHDLRKSYMQRCGQEDKERA